jgi:PTS system nitrogen regulatory IIA component
MKISDFLSPTNVTADAAFSDKQKLLQALARRAGPVVEVLADRILSDLLKREQLGSTGMGGVAVPHARFHHVEKPFGMLLRLRKPIDFDAVDGNPVDTVFLLLLADAPDGDRLARWRASHASSGIRPPWPLCGARETARKYTAR